MSQFRAGFFILLLLINPLSAWADECGAFSGAKTAADGVTYNFENYLGMPTPVVDNDGGLTLLSIYSYCSNKQKGQFDPQGKLACWDKVKPKFVEAAAKLIKYYEMTLNDMLTAGGEDETTAALKAQIKTWKAALDKCGSGKNMTDKDFDSFFKESLGNHFLELQYYGDMGLTDIATQYMPSYGFPLAPLEGGSCAEPWTDAQMDGLLKVKPGTALPPNGRDHPPGGQ